MYIETYKSFRFAYMRNFTGWKELYDNRNIMEVRQILSLNTLALNWIERRVQVEYCILSHYFSIKKFHTRSLEVSTRPSFKAVCHAFSIFLSQRIAEDECIVKVITPLVCFDIYVELSRVVFTNE